MASFKVREKLRRAWRESGLPQYKVAALTGISPTQFSELLGGVRVPNDEQEAALEKFFKIPKEELFPHEHEDEE
jgi:transcriptional regulator with XRE-family HTH domain